MEDDDISTPNDLEGLPGIGPTRRAALAVAGITTRDALARATVEQLIEITGIQRVYAVKALETARLTSGGSRDGFVVAPPDENLPDAKGTTSTVTATEPSAPEPEPPFELDRAIFKATTAVADASRKVPDSSALMRELVRTATLLDRLPTMAAALSKKGKVQIAATLNRVTARLEKTAASDVPLKPTASEKLKESVKADRERIKEILQSKVNRKLKSKK